MKRSSYYGLDLNKLSAFETLIDSNASGACEIINGHDEFTVIRVTWEWRVSYGAVDRILAKAAIILEREIVVFIAAYPPPF